MSIFVAVMPQVKQVYVNRDAIRAGAEPATYVHDQSRTGSRCEYKTLENVTQSLGCAIGGIEAETTFDNATLLRCDLVNASYSADFSFLNGRQIVRVSADPTTTPSIVDGSLEIEDMEMEHYVVKSRFDPAALRSFSFQAVMAAFNEPLLGSIVRMNENLNIDNASIMRMVLADTEEMSFIRRGIPHQM